MQKDIEKIAEHFGMKNQLSKLMEECGELIVASSKAQIEGIERHSRFSNLVEEIADVLLMIKQVMFLAGISDDSIEEVQRYKIDRTIRRYEIDKNCSNYEEDDVVILDENKVFKEFNTSTVNHPSHYNQGKYEVIDVIEDWKLCFHLGSSVKYIARAEHKGKQIEDLKKARWFLDRKIEKLEKGEDVE